MCSLIVQPSISCAALWRLFYAESGLHFAFLIRAGSLLPEKAPQLSEETEKTEGDESRAEERKRLTLFVRMMLLCLLFTGSEKQ